VIHQGEGLDTGQPVISVPPSPIIVPLGTTLVFAVAATSPRPNCAVPISASDLPAHANFESGNNRFTFMPAEDQKDRSFVIVFTATDCTGQSVTATVNVIVISTGAGGSLQAGQICVPVSKIVFNTAPVNGSCGFATVSLTNAGAGPLRLPL